jgi:hypothetical protein
MYGPDRGAARQDGLIHAYASWRLPRRREELKRQIKAWSWHVMGGAQVLEMEGLMERGALVSLLVPMGYPTTAVRTGSHWS